MKNRHIILMLIFFIFLLSQTTSCAGFVGENMPTIRLMNCFENQLYLFNSSCLIDKSTGKSINLNYSETIIDDIKYKHDDRYTYKCDFYESYFEELTYLWCNNYKENHKTEYLKCIFTFDYSGKEIDKKIIENSQSELDFNDRYLQVDDSFIIDVDFIYNLNKPEYKSEILKAIYDFAEDTYDSIDDCAGINGYAKSISNKIWFSINASEVGHFNSGEPMFSGVKQTEIFNYDPQTKKFELVFKYDKNKTIIVDFDENGAYTFDDKGRLSYYDFISKTSVLIERFSIDSTSSSFSVSDKYITLGYFNSNKIYRAIYDKTQNKIISNSLVKEIKSGYVNVSTL